MLSFFVKELTSKTKEYLIFEGFKDYLLIKIKVYLEYSLNFVLQ